MNMGDMMNMPLGVIESRCDNKDCEAPDAPLRLRALLFTDPQRPQKSVPAIQLLATKQPPRIKVKGMLIRNPDFNPADTTPIATWTVASELCNDKDCYDALMDQLWRLGQKRLKELWGLP